MLGKYEIPTYAELSKNTDILPKLLNANLSLYKPPSYAALYDSAMKLKTDYEEAKSKEASSKEAYSLRFLAAAVFSGKDKTDEVSCISLLLENHLIKPKIDIEKKELSPEALKEQEEAEESHLKILLGALIYRKRCIEDEYRESSANQWGLTSIHKTQLWPLLNIILNIGSENKLDCLSIITACQAYDDYLRDIDEKQPGLIKKHHYQRYNLIVADPKDFFAKMKKIINTAKQEFEDSAMSQPVKYIYFIQSLLPILQNYTKNLADLLTKNLEPQLQRLLGKEEWIHLKANDIKAWLQQCKPDEETSLGVLKLLLSEAKIIPEEMTLLNLAPWGLVKCSDAELATLGKAEGNRYLLTPTSFYYQYKGDEKPKKIALEKAKVVYLNEAFHNIQTPVGDLSAMSLAKIAKVAKFSPIIGYLAMIEANLKPYCRRALLGAYLLIYKQSKLYPGLEKTLYGVIVSLDKGGNHYLPPANLRLAAFKALKCFIDTLTSNSPLNVEAFTSLEVLQRNIDACAQPEPSSNSSCSYSSGPR